MYTGLDKCPRDTSQISNLAGRVVDQTGAAIANSRILLFDSAGALAEELSSDRSGEFASPRALERAPNHPMRNSTVQVLMFNSGLEEAAAAFVPNRMVPSGGNRLPRPCFQPTLYDGCSARRTSRASLVVPRSQLLPLATTVVTPARFAQGLSFSDFLAQATVNRDKLEENYQTAPLTDDDRAFFRAAAALPNGPAKLLAIGEAWCGDVYRELPTVARIAEAAGIELRIFLRDQNPDIMDEFLSNNGKSRAIPVFVFYTADLQYITQFTERSASAHAGLAVAAAEVKAELNLPASANFGNLPDADKPVFLRALIDRIRPFSEAWRKDAIKEMRQLLSAALKIPNAA
jgi:hypothetical protein